MFLYTGNPQLDSERLHEYNQARAKRMAAKLAQAHERKIADIVYRMAFGQSVEEETWSDRLEAHESFQRAGLRQPGEEKACAVSPGSV